MKIPHDPKEILAIVDDKNNVIDKATRKEIHEKGLKHREVYTFLINKNNEVLLQKRSDNHRWEASSAGHFPYNQDYEHASLREFFEEIGVKLNPKEIHQLGFEYVTNHSGNKRNNRFIDIFVVRKDVNLDDCHYDHDELERIKFFNKKDLKELVNNPKKVITDVSRMVIKKYILKELK